MRAKVTSLSLGGSTNLALMAPIKPGFVPGFETISYLERLHRLLNALNASRQNAREGELRLPVLPDAIGRFSVIRSFRYAIWPRREKQLTPTRALEGPLPSYLTLNVGFDGGFEPYMRVIYDDIGPLLDALLCHCDGYPGSRLSSYDAYCRWVREHELGEGTFFTDADAGSETTAADARHLARLERAQREAVDAAAADLAVAGIALPSLQQMLSTALKQIVTEVQQQDVTSLVLSARTLKGLYRLAPLFPPSTDGAPWPRDDLVLRGFARLLLDDVRPVFEAAANGNADLKRGFADELQWLGGPIYTRPAPQDRLRFEPQALQDAILDRNDPVTHGCMVFLRVSNPALAAARLASLKPLCDVPADTTAVRHLVAFTAAGLRALGLPDTMLDALAPEFFEGMEARNSILGDVRGNHPNQWRRPLRHASHAADRIDLSAVHVVLVLRLIDTGTESKEAPRDLLHTRLLAAAQAVADDTSGLALMALEPMFTKPPLQPGDKPGPLDFVDGLSQPIPAQKPASDYTTDEVAAGELVLGYANDRRDLPHPAGTHPLLDNGSYLVVRKLRQRSDHVQAALGHRPDQMDVLARMMGRKHDGTPLVAPGTGQTQNAFNYDRDLQGAACPFQSHVRRANPRDGRRYMPRILRRGMSYRTTDGEHGIVFMAFCASIAEQFETIQGWMAGGNSSGLASTQSDPFLGVPRPGETRSFRTLVDNGAGQLSVQRVNLGAKPLTELQWGLYLFTPSLAALAALPALRQAQPSTPPSPPQPPAGLSGLRAWRERLEDQDRSPALWAAVRALPGQRLHAPGYGTLVASRADIEQVLGDARAAQHSVHGYAGRMASTIGLNYLGLDPQEGHDAQAAVLNPVVLGITEAKAQATAYAVARVVLGQFMKLQQPAGYPGDDDGHGVRVPVDLVNFSEAVMATLCTQWFGLPDDLPTPPPDGSLMASGGRAEGLTDEAAPTRCPAHTYGASRTIFAPHPNPTVVQRGRIQGPRVLEAVKTLLARIRASQRQPTPEVRQIIDGLDAQFGQKGEPAHEAMVAGNIAGMLLGFPPTVHGNVMQILRTWIEEATLWQQQDLLAAELAQLPASASDADKLLAAARGLREPMMRTMRRCPIPEMLWRTPVENGRPVAEADDIESDRRTVLGIRSVMTDPDAPEELMFGGSCEKSSPWYGVHACPGYGMGVGVMLGMLHALLDAGTLRPTGSPVLLILTPRPAPPPAPPSAPAPAPAPPPASAPAVATAPASPKRAARPQQSRRTK